jgi:hypothetical protein
MKKVFAAFILFLFAGTLLTSAQNCIDCHTKVTPNVVKDWKMSKHFENDVDCSVCHGEAHTTMTDYKKAEMPTPETCSTCHEEQVDQFMAGKHSKAWAAIMAMPTIHMQPWPLIEGEKGCGSCHKIGAKTEAEIESLKHQGSNYGHASCDACHTRHTFSVKEAKQPQACQTCHMGFDHPQWEMYSGSKHGVRYLLKQNGTLPEDTPAPTCQDCHMPNGDHNVKTAWGFLAVRLPMPENKQWADDRATILKALGVLDHNGKPTALLDVVKAADLARLTQEDWQKERDKMIKVCSDCHSEEFAKGELEKGDEMIRHADSLMAAAIRVVDGLYQDGIIKKPENYIDNYPWLLTFHDAPTVIEQKLFVMFLEHRMRTFQGTFHANPDYALWYGWSEMVRDLSEIKELAEQMRINHELAHK